MDRFDLVPNVSVKSSGELVSTGLFYSLRNKQRIGVVSFLSSDVAPLSNSRQGDNILVFRDDHAHAPTGVPSQGFSSTLFAVREFQGFHQLFNKVLTAPVTYMPKTDAPTGLDPADNILTPRKIQQYQPGGIWFNSTLFTIQNHGDGYCRLLHKETAGYVTYLAADRGPVGRDGKHYDMLVTRLDPRYEPDGIWFDSTLFRFKPERYRLSAKVSRFTYGEEKEKEAPNTILDASSAVVWNIRNDTGTEDHSHCIQVTKDVFDTMAWSFTSSHERSFLQQSDIDVEVTAAPCQVGSCFTPEDNGALRWDKSTTNLEEIKISKSRPTKLTVSVDVSVPPGRSAEYQVEWKKTEFAGVPFVAAVRWTASADRLRLDESVAEMVEVDPEGVVALLKARGYQGVLKIEGNEVIGSIAGTVHVGGTKRGEFTRKEL